MSGAPLPSAAPASVSLRALVAVAAGGILGSLFRYAIESWIATPTAGFPWATLLINALGCLAIGMLAPLLVGTRRALRPFWITGVLGGFTTFSAFAMESVLLLDKGQAATAAAYVVATLAVGLIAVPIGQLLIRGRADG